MDQQSPRSGREPAGEELDLRRAIPAMVDASRREPYALKLGMRAVEVTAGFARVEMIVTQDMENLFGTAHGGAVFSLLDEAFQLACNSHGSTAFALNLSVTYVAASVPGDHLVAEAREIQKTRRTASYECRVSRSNGDLVAHGQALAYRKGGPPPFLSP